MLLGSEGFEVKRHLHSEVAIVMSPSLLKVKRCLQHMFTWQTACKLLLSTFSAGDLCFPVKAGVNTASNAKQKVQTKAVK